MAYLSILQEQNKGENTIRYYNTELAAVLSEMQTRKFNWSKTPTYNSYQRARRTDAEPISL